jgi:hypothetical protein
MNYIKLFFFLENGTFKKIELWLESLSHNILKQSRAISDYMLPDDSQLSSCIEG